MNKERELIDGIWYRPCCSKIWCKDMVEDENQENEDDFCARCNCYCACHPCEHTISDKLTTQPQE